MIYPQISNTFNLFDAPLKYEREIKNYTSRFEKEFIKELRKRGFTAKRIVDILESLDKAIPF